jgi:MFS family permease
MLEALIGGLLGGLSIWFCFVVVAALAAFLLGTTVGQIISGTVGVLLFLYGITKHPKTTLVITALGALLLIIYFDAVDVVLGMVIFLIAAVLLVAALLFLAGLLLAIKDILFKKQQLTTERSDHVEGVFPRGEKEAPSFQRSWRTPVSDREKSVIHTGFILYVIISAIAAWLQLDAPDWVHAVIIIGMSAFWYGVAVGSVRFTRWLQHRINPDLTVPAPPQS